MSSGKKKQEKIRKAAELSRKHTLRDQFQHNPSGGSEYARKCVRQEQEYNRWIHSDEYKEEQKQKAEESLKPWWW